ncbi:hypothetical protein OG232_04185 [Streptomyces sp. NBC_01411]|uniref:hypothetical protein n=1 Tax=Streptomyces sp. NBC_01411 TaxID=2903857 RepID=UPI00324D0D5E
MTDQPQPADLRQGIADALADADGWVWAQGFDKTRSPSYRDYLRQADAMIAVLPDFGPAYVRVGGFPAGSDRAAFRGRLDAAIDEVFTRWEHGLGEQRPQDAICDAVLAVLSAPATTETSR